MLTNNSFGEFRRSLSATIAWCAAVEATSDIALRFRSSQLRPPIDIAGNTDSLELVRSAVDYVIARRYERLGMNRLGMNRLGMNRLGMNRLGMNRLGMNDDDATPTLSAGRLLAYYPGFSLFDGFAAIESEGFFDTANVPPWDTWVYFVDDFLISFVPLQCTTHVECGLITNVEECIIWLRDVNHPFVHELKARNLVD